MADKFYWSLVCCIKLRNGLIKRTLSTKNKEFLALNFLMNLKGFILLFARVISNRDSLPPAIHGFNHRFELISY